MKLWKGATFAILLCCASLCVLLTKPAMMPAVMPPTPAKQHSWVASPVSPPLLSTSSSPSTTTSPPSQTASSSSPPRSTEMGGLRRRRARSADNVGTLLSECKLPCFCLQWQQCQCWWGGTWKALTAGLGFSLRGLRFVYATGAFFKLRSYAQSASTSCVLATPQTKVAEWAKKCANILTGAFGTPVNQGQCLGSNKGWASD